MGNSLIRRGLSTSHVHYDLMRKERAKFTYCQDNFDKLNFNVYPYYIERAWWKQGARMTFWSTWRQAANVRRRQAFATYGPDRMRYKAMATNNGNNRRIQGSFKWLKCACLQDDQGENSIINGRFCGQDFSSPDYPAMFGIIAGVSVVLVVAVTFIVVGLLSMEPAKDSIIYRMTNTRIKKD
ncbi:hypothetical protein Mgra_00007184 [Meloidogyne graminicola]|uniref:Renin receptor-like C-terminal transmembrane spanning segment domain-containing protein n=1 Tax=Meloidogyne graminicola TaxID=189291 RepID=A0A8S9ZJQ2_9BILA|nr:hypothetical protein Mgra_00007184 [Meloidogyne graminicola]